MTVHRRSLLLSAAVALVLPACISINAKPEPIAPSELAARITAEGAARTTAAIRKPRTEFAMYPSRPGETVPTKSIPKDTTTAQKTTPVPPGPIAPSMPGPGDVMPASEPGTFPLAQTRVSTIPEPPLLAAVRAFIEGRQERAIEHIMSLDKPNQDLVLALVPVLARGATANLAGDPVAVAVLLEQLHSAAAQLESHAALRVDAALFCEVVHGFGRYTPWPVNKPYRPNEPAQLYLEVRHLVSQHLGSQQALGPRGETYLTHAYARVEVLDAYKKRVPQPDPNDYRRRVEVVEFERKLYTRAPVRDFHLLYAFPVPATPGVYTVTVELQDATGRRVVKTAPVQFCVAGP